MQKLPGRARTPEREIYQENVNAVQIVPESEDFDISDILSDSISTFNPNIEFIIVP